MNLSRHLPLVTRCDGCRKWIVHPARDRIATEHYCAHCAQLLEEYLAQQYIPDAREMAAYEAREQYHRELREELYGTPGNPK